MQTHKIHCVARVLSGLLFGLSAMGAAAMELTPLWQAPLDDALRGRIYQTAIVPGAIPKVIATTSDAVLLFDRGKSSTLFSLERGGAFGKSAVLPVNFQGDAAEQGRIGLLVHNHHAVERFELVDLAGNAVAEVKDPRYFLFRLAPDGKSFVGIDAGNTHTALAADKVTYRFFDMKANARQVEGIVSARPAPSHDSAYTPDGKAFLINSQESGLAAYDAHTMQPLYRVPQPVASFAAANAELGRVLVKDGQTRERAALYQGGKLQYAISLADFGVKEHIRNLALSPNGQYAVVTGRSLAVLIGPNGPQPQGVFKVSEGHAINSVAVNDVGIVAVGAQAADLKGGELWFLDAQSAQPIADVQRTVHQHTNAWIPTVQFDASGQYLLAKTLEGMRLYAMPLNAARK